MSKRIAIAVVVLEYICLATSKITIKELKVPQYIKNEDVKSIVLDCDYELEDENGLEVKWFFNDIQQIYQWIPEVTKPQAIGAFKDIIDTSYKASNDANKEYRALHFKQVSPSLSGNYTCKVSGFKDEDAETKRMTIYEPAKSIKIMYMENTQTVICAAHGISPKPNVTVTAEYLSGKNESLPDLSVKEYVLDEMEDSRYNITAIYDAPPSTLEESLKFTCILTIPDTDYMVIKSFVTYAGASIRNINLTFLVPVLLGITVFNINM